MNTIRNLLQRLDLVFPYAPFPAEEKSDAEGVYDPPYYEWFQSNKDYSEHRNSEECIAFIEDYMIKNGPFDGVLGLSQGVALAACLPGIQRDGVGLTRIPAIKIVIIISGAKLGGSKFGTPPLAATAFSTLQWMLYILQSFCAHCNRHWIGTIRNMEDRILLQQEMEHLGKQDPIFEVDFLGTFLSPSGRLHRCF